MVRYHFHFENNQDLSRARERLATESLEPLYQLEGMGNNVPVIVVDTPVIAGIFCQVFVVATLNFQFRRRFTYFADSSDSSDSDSGPLSDHSDHSEGSGYSDFLDR